MSGAIFFGALGAFVVLRWIFRPRPLWIVQIYDEERKDWFTFAHANGTPVVFQTEESAEVSAKSLYPARVLRKDFYL